MGEGVGPDCQGWMGPWEPCSLVSSQHRWRSLSLGGGEGGEEEALPSHIR